jgi:GNAT superfamily N-acetyltransferase
MTALPQGLRIRSFREGDVDQVWALHIEGVQVTRAQHEVDYSQYESDLHSIPETYLDGGGFWVVEAPEGLVGMGAVERIDAETGRIRRMRVTERWRRQGVAQALVETAERFCREGGFRRIILDTMAQQVEARRLYEKNGFRRTGERMLGPFRTFDYEKVLD